MMIPPPRIDDPPMDSIPMDGPRENDLTGCLQPDPVSNTLTNTPLSPITFRVRKAWGG